MRTQIKIYIIAIVAITLVTACSTRKNTFMSRSYHTLTTKYNVAFNANEAYKKGIKKLNTEVKDDYTEVLPIFAYPNTESLSVASSDMDRCIKKAKKAITLHSITAKPVYKKGTRTESQKKFYNKREFNPLIDDAYLILAKSNLMKGEYMLTSEALRYIIKEYPAENNNIETRIWLARTLVAREEYAEAEDMLVALEGEKIKKKALISLYNAVYADLYIHKKKIDKAIPYLELALQKAPKKREKVRYTFILGQLYLHTGQLVKATQMYLKVIKMSPPYEMTFNARISLANAFESGMNSEQIRAQLIKLLKDFKNKEFQDQIYYAIANIDYKEGKINEAIENYKLSSINSVSNNKQKAKSFIAIADIYYSKRSYLDAQVYYDSAMLIIDESFPKYSQISAKAKSLNSLVGNLNMVIFEDSVLDVAKMTESERNIFIDKIIEKVKEKEIEEKRLEQERMQETQMNMMAANEMGTRNSMNNSSGNDGKWYFYNPASKGFGQTEFKMKWGARKLEDNWRRSNKKVVLIDPDAENNDEKENKDKKKIDNKSREFYMQNVPLSDSAKTESHIRIKQALYDAGITYKDELLEYELAVKKFEEIIKRYPDLPIVADASYQLIILYKQLNNLQKVDLYRNIIITKYPNSVYASVLTNPNYIKEIEEKENRVNVLYAQTYKFYNTGAYMQVINNANNADTVYPHHPVLVKFALLRAIAKGKIQGNDVLRTELQAFVKDNVKGDENELARAIIAEIDVAHPEAKIAEEQKIAQEIYSLPSDNDAHLYCMVVINNAKSKEQIKFNLINFNIDNYPTANLNIKEEVIAEKNAIITVGLFKSKAEALNYFDAASINSDVLKDANSLAAIFIINEANLATLVKDGGESKYLQYFKINYNR